jgi:hypothetical protein
MKRKTVDAIYFGLIILVVIFIMFVAYYMVANKEAFVDNPFVFGASKMRGDVHCTCQQLIEDKKYQFAFNKTDWWNEPTEQFLIPPS